MQTVALMRAAVREARTLPGIIHAAQSIVGLVAPHDFNSEARTLYEFVRSRVRYVRDVHDVETLTAPLHVLDRMCGDCDDKSMLLASLYEAVGFPTRFVMAGYHGNLFEHVYLQVLVDDCWVTADPTVPESFGWEAPGATVYWVEKV